MRGGQILKLLLSIIEEYGESGCRVGAWGESFERANALPRGEKFRIGTYLEPFYKPRLVLNIKSSTKT